MNKRKIILDVDTGTDDAVAMMAALSCDQLEILGICTVNGNKPLSFTTENTLRVVQYLGVKIPVFKGCDTPLVAGIDPLRFDMCHMTPIKTGEEGNQNRIHPDYLALPESTIQHELTPAAMWVVDTLKNSDEKITMVQLGPLTNLALALRLDPSIAENIEEVVMMGGGHMFGNRTPAAEFNVLKDPEAAQIVFECGAKITMVPLDATHEAFVTLADADDFESFGTKAGKFAAELVRHRVHGYAGYWPMERTDITPLHDGLCIAYLIDPEVLKNVTFMRVDVDCGGGIADGCTICDTRAIPQKPRNVNVALGGNPEKYAAVLKSLFSKEI